jgi:CrcB protein
MVISILAIAAGAALGAILRWLLAISMNGLFPLLPLGTLLANLGGGYLIGLAAAMLLVQPGISAEWRLFVMTGFLGGLTTFSAFSLEASLLMQQGRAGWALTMIGAHVLGSLTMTALGFATISLWQRVHS